MVLGNSIFYLLKGDYRSSSEASLSWMDVGSPGAAEGDATATAQTP